MTGYRRSLFGRGTRPDPGRRTDHQARAHSPRRAHGPDRARPVGVGRWGWDSQVVFQRNDSRLHGQVMARPTGCRANSIVRAARASAGTPIAPLRVPADALMNRDVRVSHPRGTIHQEVPASWVGPRSIVTFLAQQHSVGSTE